MTTGSLAVLVVTSHEVFYFFLLLRESYKPANDSTIVSFKKGQRLKVGLTNSQNMVFRYEYAYLDLTYLNHKPYLKTTKGIGTLITAYQLI